VKVCHVSTVHSRNDTRIFLKECRSLAAAGHEVIYLVADGKGDETRDGVRIVDAGARPRGRIARFRFSAHRMAAAAFTRKADIYHMHDPELAPAGLRLSRAGVKVIYDAHEDLPRQLQSKPYINPALARPLAWIVELYENRACSRFDAVISATEAIGRRFDLVARRTAIVHNYPSLEELGLERLEPSTRFPKACFVGGLTEIRGIRQLASASLIARFPIEAAGPVNSGSLAEFLAGSGSKIRLLGSLGRREVSKLLVGASAGLVTYLPMPNHVEALPTKIFEYMAAGLPVIASNFPLWREIVEGGECGRCVDPSDPRAIAAAIDEIVGNPELARRMGSNGRRLVEERYNWAIEERTLLDLYQELEKSP